MSKQKTTLKDYMTAHPYSIGIEQTLEKAHELMRKHLIRHLPVLHGGKLEGILSLRDLQFIETLPDVDPTAIRVDEAMSSDVYAASSDESLADAARVMAQRKLGSAVVVEHGKVVGLFTTVDALRALADAIEAE
jgi:acetoin utilization protein AcuB